MLVCLFFSLIRLFSSSSSLSYLLTMLFFSYIGLFFLMSVYLLIFLLSYSFFVFFLYRVFVIFFFPFFLLYHVSSCFAKCLCPVLQSFPSLIYFSFICLFFFIMCVYFLNFYFLLLIFVFFFVMSSCLLRACVLLFKVFLVLHCVESRSRFFNHVFFPFPSSSICVW